MGQICRSIRFGIIIKNGKIQSCHFSEHLVLNIYLSKVNNALEKGAKYVQSLQ